MNSIGPLIKTARKKKGWLQKDLARKARCYPADISGWETGETTPTLPSIRKLSIALDKPLTYFVENNATLDNQLQARKELDETFAQYHEWLDLILMEGTEEQQRFALGLLAVESGKIRKKKDQLKKV